MISESTDSTCRFVSFSLESLKGPATLGLQASVICTALHPCKMKLISEQYSAHHSHWGRSRTRDHLGSCLYPQSLVYFTHLGGLPGQTKHSRFHSLIHSISQHWEAGQVLWISDSDAAGLRRSLHVLTGLRVRPTMPEIEEPRPQKDLCMNWWNQCFFPNI